MVHGHYCNGAIQLAINGEISRASICESEAGFTLPVLGSPVKAHQEYGVLFRSMWYNKVSSGEKREQERS